MPSLKTLKTRISSVKNTKKVTKTMQLISAIKFQKSYQQLEFLNNYRERLVTLNNELTLDLAISLDAEQYEMFDSAVSLEDNAEQVADKKIESNIKSEFQAKSKKVFVIVSTDRGLAGEFLTSLKRWVLSNRETLKENQTLLVGKKITSLVNQIQSELLNRYSIPTNLAAEEFVELLSQELGLYAQSKTEIVLVSTKFKSGRIFIQEEILDFSPVKEENEEDLMTYKLEPDYKEVAWTIKNQLLRVQLLAALQNSHVAEQFSRMVYMQTATDSASEIISDLQLSYNKSRQSAITQEISEIVGGMSVESIAQKINNLNQNISINLAI